MNQILVALVFIFFLKVHNNTDDATQEDFWFFFASDYKMFLLFLGALRNKRFAANDNKPGPFLFFST